MRSAFSSATLIALSALQLASSDASAQASAAATFKSSVEIVRVAAVVRDRKGRFVEDLKATDFEVLDTGLPRPIAEFRHDLAGISLALLFDVSGSMEARLADARDAAAHLLHHLDTGGDEAAVFTFDTGLVEITPFTSGLQTLPDQLATVTPFGATSLHDAIAQTAEKLRRREGRRRAVVVFTDGNDTASRLTPADVSAVASAIDVPVYIVGVVSPLDHPSQADRTSGRTSPFDGALADLSAWTGGHVFVLQSPAERSASARQIVDELRHQYLIAFESSGRPGWHPLVVRARGKDLIVRARSGYVAGQSRPIS